MTALLLGALGLVTSFLAPALLSRAHWPWRVPRASIVLRQALSAAAVLSAFGVILAGPEEVVRANGSAQRVAEWVLIGALVVAALILLRLLVSLIDVTYRSRARRARHRMLVDLLDRAEDHGDLDDAVRSGALRVLDGQTPFAYCLPGRSARVVLSGGTLAVLAPAGVRAVLAHEQAHLRRRHDVVLESFTALYRAVPSFLRSGSSLHAVHLLLEMLADDAAVREQGRSALRSALEAMGSAGKVDGAAEDTGRDPELEVRARLTRLGPDWRGPSPVLAAATYGVAAGVLVLPTVVLVVPWLSKALPHWPL